MQYPATLEDAVAFVLSRMDEHSRTNLRGIASADDVVVDSHFIAGPGTQNLLGLSDKSQALMMEMPFGKGYPDGASGGIIVECWRR